MKAATGATVVAAAQPTDTTEVATPQGIATLIATPGFGAPEQPAHAEDRSFYWEVPNGIVPTVPYRLRVDEHLYRSYAKLRVNIRHPRRGQLKIRLQSPEEVVSTFANVHPDPNANYPGWLFTSVRHFGESSADGEWRVCVEDGVPRDAYGNGMFDSFELAVFGH